MPVPIAFRCIVAHIHPAAEQKPPHSCFQAIGNGRFPPLLHPCRIWHTDKTRKGRVPYWSGTLPADGRRAGSKSARTMKPRPSETPPTIPCLLSGDTLRSLGFHPPTMIASLPTLDASRQLSGRGQSDDVHPPSSVSRAFAASCHPPSESDMRTMLAFVCMLVSGTLGFPIFSGVSPESKQGTMGLHGRRVACRCCGFRLLRSFSGSVRPARVGIVHSVIAGVQPHPARTEPGGGVSSQPVFASLVMCAFARMHGSFSEQEEGRMNGGRPLPTAA